MQPTCEELAALVEQFRQELAAVNEVVHQQREMIQILRDEIAVLKKQKPKPKIPPSKLTEQKKKQRPKRKRKQKDARKVDKIVKLEAKDVPEGSRFKGYSDFFVQELVIKSVSVGAVAHA